MDDSRVYTAQRAAGYAARRTPRWDRDDAAQDALVAILEAEPRYDPAQGSWFAYCVGVADRALCRRWRTAACLHRGGTMQRHSLSHGIDAPAPADRARDLRIDLGHILCSSAPLHTLWRAAYVAGGLDYVQD